MRMNILVEKEVLAKTRFEDEYALAHISAAMGSLGSELSLGESKDSDSATLKSSNSWLHSTFFTVNWQ